MGGVLPPPGETVWEQSRWIAQDQTLRNFVLNEPRGGVFRHVNLLVPPKHPEAQAAWIIMEPEDTPPMSGSNSICVATVLLDSGLVPMQEPETNLVLEAPGGLVRARAGNEEKREDRGDGGHRGVRLRAERGASADSPVVCRFPSERSRVPKRALGAGLATFGGLPSRRVRP